MQKYLSLWVVLAVAVFWAVGVHNRLMRLRAAVWDAAASFERQMHVLTGICKVALLERDPCVQGVETLALAVQTMVLAMKGGKQAKGAASPIDYCTAMGTPWAQLQQSAEAYFLAAGDTPDPVSGAALGVTWTDGCTKANFAKAAATLAVADYNAALGQAPACWVAGLMGFERLMPLA
ncbi:MAG: hypothetical protein WCK81_07335 [Betaproteobacteria bacterium]